jgi:hypothetical protein
MKRWSAVLVVVLALAPCARADEASKRAKVKELFVVMKLDTMMEQITKTIMDQTQTMIGGMADTQITPAQKKMMDDYKDRLYKLVMDTMGWKAIEPEYVEMYANTYSEEEIDGILAFYNSPAGRAMMARTPELMQKSTALSQQKMAEIQPKMKALMDQMMKDMTEQLAAPKPAPKPRAKT